MTATAETEHVATVRGREQTTSLNRRLTTSLSSSWLSWLVGAALVVGISLIALHFSEAEEIARLAERAQPWWLSLAFALQALTYLAQGEIWRALGKAAMFPLSRRLVFQLSIAKLFIDQALPSAGISGTAAIAKQLESRGMSKPAVMAGVVVNITSYFATYVVLLLSALLLLPWRGRGHTAVMIAAALFIIGSIAIVIAMLALPGHLHLARLGKGIGGRLMKLRALRGSAAFFEEADISLVRKPALFLEASLWQAAIVILDAGTVLVLIESLGVTASATAVFSSFMISNLFRTLGVLPGGLGTFEASSVITLGFAGISLPVALSATLLFRGLSFWLPMIPGLWLSRRLFGLASSSNQPTP